MTSPRLLVPLACAALAVGCTGDPAPPPSPSPTASTAALDAADPDREALVATVAELRDTVTALRAALEAAEGGDADALGTAAELLVADVGAAMGDEPSSPDGEADGPAPVLPGPLVSREESIQYGDLLTRTLAAARGAGSTGEPVLRFLADPLAGDLGAWQRAPADQLEAIAGAAGGADLADTEAAVLDLQGEAPRALAWVLHGLAVPADAPDAAGRALAHLTIVELALTQLE